MINKHAVLLAVLIPGMAVLAGCNERDTDDTVSPVATTKPVQPANSMPAPNMPVTTIPDQAEWAEGNKVTFGDRDKNQDGGITKDELADTDMLHQHFSAADTDGDGRLTESEIIFHRAEMAAATAK